MKREEAAQLAAYIKEDGASVVAVLGVEPLGSAARGLFVDGYFVKCAYRSNGLPFVVKSYEQWESRKTPPLWL